MESGAACRAPQKKVKTWGGGVPSFWASLPWCMRQDRVELQQRVGEAWDGGHKYALGCQKYMHTRVQGNHVIGDTATTE